MFKYLEDECGVKYLNEVTHNHIKAYFSYLKSNGLTESYINTILKSLRAFYNYCVIEEYITKNPCLKVRWQRQKKTIIQSFTDEEIIKMLNAFDYKNYLNARNKAIIALLADTGIRNLELCMIRKVDVKERFILIHGKGNKERYVPITPMLNKILIKFERIREYYLKDKVIVEDGYFLSRTSRILTVEAIERIVCKAGKTAEVRPEIRCSPHTFRHYYAQKQLRNGLDVYSLSRLLGHENINITKRYLQSINDYDVLEKSIKTSPLMSLES